MSQPAIDAAPIEDLRGTIGGDVVDPSEDDRNVAWTRDFAAAMAPFGIGREAFPNFIAAGEGNARVRESYGEDKYQRLVELKNKWDPDNLFRLNQNIAPGA